MQTSPEMSDKLRDAQDALQEEKRACFEKEAANRLREQLMSDGRWPNIDTTLDLFRDNIVDMVGSVRFKEVLIGGRMDEIGLMVYQKFIGAREEVIEGKIGQMVVEDIINEMWESNE